MNNFSCYKRFWCRKLISSCKEWNILWFSILLRERYHDHTCPSVSLGIDTVALCVSMLSIQSWPSCVSCEWHFLWFSDDSMAILMAFQTPELEILGLTTVFGNVTTKDATRNALLLVCFCFRWFHLPVQWYLSWHNFKSVIFFNMFMIKLPFLMCKRIVWDRRTSWCACGRRQPWTTEGKWVIYMYIPQLKLSVVCNQILFFETLKLFNQFCAY